MTTDPRRARARPLPSTAGPLAKSAVVRYEFVKRRGQRLLQPVQGAGHGDGHRRIGKNGKCRSASVSGKFAGTPTGPASRRRSSRASSAVRRLQHALPVPAQVAAGPCGSRHVAAEKPAGSHRARDGGERRTARGAGGARLQCAAATVRGGVRWRLRPVAPTLRLRALLGEAAPAPSDAISAIIVGSGRRVFERFRAAPEATDGARHPLDRFTRAAVGAASRRALGAAGVAYRTYFPFTDSVPALPFQRLGRAAGIGPPGPSGPAESIPSWGRGGPIAR